MTLTSDYYSTGFTRGQFKGPSLARLLETMEELFDGGSLRSTPSQPGFRWEQKYPGTIDLRPNVHTYDPSFLDVLVEGGVPELLVNAVGTDMVLFHTQVRKSFPGPSYMDWHRDSYDFGTPVGNFPPAHKVIFYPALARQPWPKLKLIPGSHIRHGVTQVDDTRNAFNAEDDGQCHYYESSDSEFLLFNTALLHGAVPDLYPSIRVIYSFIRRVQFEELYASQQVHADQVRLYEERLAR